MSSQLTSLSVFRSCEFSLSSSSVRGTSLPLFFFSFAFLTFSVCNLLLKIFPTLAAYFTCTGNLIIMSEPQIFIALSKKFPLEFAITFSRQACVLQHHLKIFFFRRARILLFCFLSACLLFSFQLYSTLVAC